MFSNLKSGTCRLLTATCVLMLSTAACSSDDNSDNDDTASGQTGENNPTTTGTLGGSGGSKSAATAGRGGSGSASKASAGRSASGSANSAASSGTANTRNGAAAASAGSSGSTGAAAGSGGAVGSDKSACAAAGSGDAAGTAVAAGSCGAAGASTGAAPGSAGSAGVSAGAAGAATGSGGAAGTSAAGAAGKAGAGGGNGNAGGAGGAGGASAAMAGDQSLSGTPDPSLVSGTGDSCQSYTEPAAGKCGGWYCGVDQATLTKAVDPSAVCGGNVELLCSNAVPAAVASCARTAKTANIAASNDELRPMIRDCVFQDMMIQQGATPECVDCLIDVAACASDNCLTQCLTGDSPGCDSCRRQNNCDQMVFSCGGLPAPI